MFKNLKEREIIINEKDKSSSEKINIAFILSKSNNLNEKKNTENSNINEETENIKIKVKKKN